MLWPEFTSKLNLDLMCTLLRKRLTPYKSLSDSFRPLGQKSPRSRKRPPGLSALGLQVFFLPLRPKTWNKKHLKLDFHFTGIRGKQRPKLGPMPIGKNGPKPYVWAMLPILGPSFPYLPGANILSLPTSGRRPEIDSLPVGQTRNAGLENS